MSKDLTYVGELSSYWSIVCKMSSVKTIYCYLCVTCRDITWLHLHSKVFSLVMWQKNLLVSTSKHRMPVETVSRHLFFFHWNWPHSMWYAPLLWSGVRRSIPLSVPSTDSSRDVQLVCCSLGQQQISICSCCRRQSTAASSQHHAVIWGMRVDADLWLNDLPS